MPRPRNHRKKVASFSLSKWILNTIGRLTDQEYMPDSKSAVVDLTLRKGLKEFPDALNDSEMFLVNNTERHRMNEVKQEIIERENTNASIKKKKLTFESYIDKEMLNVFFRLVDYHDPEMVEYKLKEFLKAYKKRAEHFNQSEIIEDRINNPMKYVSQKLDQKKRYTLLKYLDNDYNVNEYVSKDLNDINRRQNKFKTDKNE